LSRLDSVRPLGHATHLEVLVVRLGEALSLLVGRMVRFYEAFGELRRRTAYDLVHYMKMLYIKKCSNPSHCPGLPSNNMMHNSVVG
jgi:hypothetical protein